MKISRVLISVCAGTIGIIASHATWALPITVTGNSITSYVCDTSCSQDPYYGTAIPATDTLTAVNGNSSSSTTYDYSDNSTSATFAYDFSHSIDNTVGDTSGSDLAFTYLSGLYFTADSNSSYSIDGYYAMMGPNGTRAYLSSSLWDQTDNTYSFLDDTESRSTMNESFVLGEINDGDFDNNNLGSLTGNLIAGHSYVFYLQAFITALDSSDTVSLVAATADGAVNLHVGAVPVPTSIWLFGSGLLGLIGIARRKKAA